MSVVVLGHVPRDWPNAHRCTEPHWCEDQKAPNSEQGTIQRFCLHHIWILFYPFPLPGCHVSELSPDYSSSGWRCSGGHRKEGEAWLHFRQHCRVLVKASVKAKFPGETPSKGQGQRCDSRFPSGLILSLFKMPFKLVSSFWTIQYWRLRGKNSPPDFSSFFFCFSGKITFWNY